MNTNDPNNPNNMVSRQDGSRNPFTVQRPTDTNQQAQEAADLAKEVSEAEAELQGIEEGVAQRKEELKQKAERAAEAIRQAKLTEWRTKMDDAADFAEMSRTSADPEVAKDFFRKSKFAEREAAHLAQQIGLDVPTSVSGETSGFKLPLSTNKALLWIACLFIAFVGLTWHFGSPLEADPMNATGQSIMKNAPIRALLSFTLTFATFLVAVFFIRVAFPQFYRIWHNRIDSERSLDSLLAEAPAWAVLLSLLGLFYTFMQLFASFYQAMYA